MLRILILPLFCLTTQLSVPKISFGEETPKITPTKTRQFETEGLLGNGEDGTYIISTLVTKAMRNRLADAQRLPLKAIAASVDRRLRLSDKSPSIKEIESKIGKKVRVVIEISNRNQYYLIGFKELKKSPQSN